MNHSLLPSHFESLYPEDTRFVEVEKVLGFIKEGNSCQVIGLPGVGRSNLLQFLPYNKKIRTRHLGENQKWFHFVPVNFPEIRKRPLFDATKFLFLALLESVHERKMETEYQAMNAMFKESLSFHDELVLFQGLKRAVDLLAIEKELTIVFLFDRFEEYIPMLTPQFFLNLQTLRSRAKYRFSVVFSLNRPLEDVLEPILFADFYEYLAGHIVTLPITDKPGMDFRLSYLQKVTEKTLDETLVARIMQLTAGHMKLTRLSLEAILSLPETIDGKKLESYLLTHKTVRAGLYEIWHYLLPSEQEYLVDLLEKKEPTGEKNTFDFLESIGLIKDKKLTIPLLVPFIQEQAETNKANADKISLDPNTNDVLQGGVSLSDKLTASEYRLLLYLIQNAEKIVSREDIIKSVWFDAKSTAGVTDQALDQLIFRVRKKIEQDPNNPTHLQTIKGRGFRFTL